MGGQNYERNKYPIGHAHGVYRVVSQERRQNEWKEVYDRNDRFYYTVKCTLCEREINLLSTNLNKKYRVTCRCQKKQGRPKIDKTAVRPVVVSDGHHKGKRNLYPVGYEHGDFTIISEEMKRTETFGGESKADYFYVAKCRFCDKIENRFTKKIIAGCGTICSCRGLKKPVIANQGDDNSAVDKAELNEQLALWYNSLFVDHKEQRLKRRV